MSSEQPFERVEVPAVVLDALPGSFRQNVAMFNVNVEMRERMARALLAEMADRQDRMDSTKFALVRDFAQSLLKPKN